MEIIIFRESFKNVLDGLPEQMKLVVTAKEKQLKIS
jgi:hypothetical protein